MVALKDVDIEEVIQSLRYDLGFLPKEALRAAIEYKEKSLPKFIEILEEDAKKIKEYEKSSYIFPFYAIFIFAYLKDSSVSSVLLKFLSSHPTIVREILGDAAEDSLAKALANVSYRDAEGIGNIIKNARLNSIIRKSAFASFIVMYAQRKISRKDLLLYSRDFLRLPHEKDPSFISRLVVECLNIYPEELMDDIEKLFKENRVDLWLVSWQGVRRQMNRSKREVLGEMYERYGKDLGDPVAELNEWYAFRETEDLLDSDPLNGRKYENCRYYF